MKKTLTICIICVLVLLVIAASVVAVLNVVAFQQAKKIVYQMPYEEVVDLLGDPVPSELGFSKSEWRLANGDKIWIWFENAKDTGETYVTGYFIE